jgi:hypothetical protein
MMGRDVQKVSVELIVVIGETLAQTSGDDRPSRRVALRLKRANLSSSALTSLEACLASGTAKQRLNEFISQV